MKTHRFLSALVILLFTGCLTPVYVNLSKDKIRIDHYKAQASAGIASRCPPAFPFKEGWLGGDGDVSVPLDPTTTLFLFSDTYVGNKKQKSREDQGLKMIANSAAIQSCVDTHSSDIQYYWNRKYTKNPAPIFRPLNIKHKFWVVDAFICQSNLYVLLEEIAPKPDSDPDDIFNFTQKGFTMATISNPYEKPDQWVIDYTPLSGFRDSLLSIRCHAKDKKHVYFFVSRDDRALLLMRKAIKDFENMEKPFEYYTLNETWETGAKKDKVAILVNGFRCNTVKYHPDLKQWIMICDIEFMENEIKMRTAPELTGPWSDEITIYKIPETTPGNDLYQEGNFCYLARECIQNYDSQNKKLTLTYDVNNSDMATVILNPTIYTPKVIQIALNQTKQ